MASIKPLIIRTCRAIEPSFFVASYFIIASSTVDYFTIVTVIIVSPRGMVYFCNIMILDRPYVRTTYGPRTASRRKALGRLMTLLPV